MLRQPVATGRLTQPAEYFITIYSYQHICIFGDTVEDTPTLSRLGIIVNDCRAAIPRHFSIVDVHVSVIIPYHFHGILKISDDVGRGTTMSCPC